MVARLLVAALMLCLATLAHAGLWPQVGDQFMTDDDALLVVAKIKKRPDVGDSLVCMHRSGTRAPDRSCTWTKIGELHGAWIIYGGVDQ